MKFGELEHMTDLLENGTIYCNEVAYFAKKSDGCRYDEYELVQDMSYHEGGKMTLHPIDKPEEIIEFQLKNFQMKGSITNPVDNLYCLFALQLEDKPDGYEFLLDSELQKFGTHFVLIHNSAEFSKRVSEKLKEDKIEIEQGLIEYKDLPKFSGKKDFFSKPLEFKYQQEYRLHLKTGKTEYYKFSIGDISDIAKLYETKKVERIRKSNSKLTSSAL